MTDGMVPEVVEALRRSITVRNPALDALIDAALARWRAEEAAMSRWAKLRRSVRRRRTEAVWRLTYAWRHLRGIECDRGDE